LSLQERDGQLVLEIRDNGKGFDTSREFPGHLGLRSMPERAAQIGSEFQIQSLPGKGTVITVRLSK
jgi:signal transduction histidine kinase